MKKKFKLLEGMKITRVQYMDGTFDMDRNGLDPKKINWENVITYIQCTTVPLSEVLKK